jgi:hypothetical protein
MSEQNIEENKIPNFWNAITIHGFFGILEYLLIVITIFFYVSNIAFLIICIGITSALFIVLSYSLLFKNPYYYIACIGLICITVFPSAIESIIYIGSTTWSYEPVKIFIIVALIIETLYIFILIREISYNKYLSYFHDRYTIGYPLRKGTTLLANYYSTKDFDKLDKGRQYWQDRNPEPVKQLKEVIENLKKKYKKNVLITIQIFGFILFNVMFYVSNMF